MSGGHFDYQQFRIREIADSIRKLIDTNEKGDINDYGTRIFRNYPKDIIKKFKQAHQTLIRAEKMVHRIDWLVSDDDSEETFLKYWDEEIGHD